MRDAFAVLFFVSIGMLLDPLQLLAGAVARAGGARASWSSASRWSPRCVLALMRYPLRTVLTVPSALAQIGEFSFILARARRATSACCRTTALNIVVAVSIVSILINPVASRLIEPVEHWLSRRRLCDRRAAGRRLVERGASLVARTRATAPSSSATGRPGRTVTRLLRENGISPTVDRAEHGHRARAAGGGRSRPSTATRATRTRSSRPASAMPATLIVSGADSGAPETIRAARELNPPRARLRARRVSARRAASCASAGAEHVFSGEGEVALAMTEAVLRRLGATPDQIDRERQRLHGELFGRTPRADSALRLRR